MFKKTENLTVIHNVVAEKPLTSPLAIGVNSPKITIDNQKLVKNLKSEITKNYGRLSQTRTELNKFNAFLKASEWLLNGFEHIIPSNNKATVDNLPIPKLRDTVSKCFNMNLNQEEIINSDTAIVDKSLVHKWHKAIWFDLREVPFEPDKDMMEFGKELIQNKIIQLPFPDTVIVNEFQNNGKFVIVCQLLRQEEGKIRKEGSVVIPTNTKNQPLMISIEFNNRIKFDPYYIDPEIYYFLAVLNSKAVQRKRNLLTQHHTSNKKIDYNSYFTVALTEKSKSLIGVGSHASPRLHWRRGHIRHLSNEKTTWVRATLVGAAEGGVIIHDYKALGSLKKELE